MLYFLIESHFSMTDHVPVQFIDPVVVEWTLPF